MTRSKMRAIYSTAAYQLSTQSPARPPSSVSSELAITMGSGSSDTHSPCSNYASRRTLGGVPVTLKLMHRVPVECRLHVTLGPGTS